MVVIYTTGNFTGQDAGETSDKLYRMLLSQPQVGRPAAIRFVKSKYLVK